MTNSFDLTGKTAIVTGANTGLGQAIAVALAQAGASIVGVGRSAMDETERPVPRAGAAFTRCRRTCRRLEPVDRIVPEAIDRRPDRHSGQQCRHHPPRRCHRLHGERTGTT